MTDLPRISIAEAARAAGARLEGDGALTFARLAAPADAGPDALVYAADAEALAQAAAGGARAALTGEGADWRAAGLAAALVSARPRYALAGLSALFDAARDAGPPGVDPLASVARGAAVDPTAAIGPFCVVAEGAVIGPGARLVAQVHVGRGATIGAGCLLHPGARIGWGVTLGARCIVHPNAVIGADGFSFVTPERGAAEAARAGEGVGEAVRNTRLARIHSLGAVRVGDDVEIGAGATVDRGTLTDTVIGDGAKIDNLVQIAHNVTVGRNAMLCAQAGVAGSTTLGDRVVLGGQAGVADHVRVGDDVVAGARSGIGADVAPRQVVLGAPALPRDETIQILLATRRLPRLARTVAAIKKRLSAIDPNG